MPFLVLDSTRNDIYTVFGGMKQMPFPKIDLCDYIRKQNRRYWNLGIGISYLHITLYQRYLYVIYMDICG